MRSKQILYPLDDDTPQTVIRNRKDIKAKLNDLKEGKNITFDQTLEELGVTEHEYILAIRSSVS